MKKGYILLSIAGLGLGAYFLFFRKSGQGFLSTMPQKTGVKSQQPGIQYPVQPAQTPRVDQGISANFPWAPQATTNATNSSGIQTTANNASAVNSISKSVTDFWNQLSPNRATNTPAVAPAPVNPNLQPIDDKGDYYLDTSVLDPMELYGDDVIPDNGTLDF